MSLVILPGSLSQVWIIVGWWEDVPIVDCYVYWEISLPFSQLLSSRFMDALSGYKRDGIRKVPDVFYLRQISAVEAGDILLCCSLLSWASLLGRLCC